MSDNETPSRLYRDQQELLHAACCARDEALAWVADLIHDRESKGIGAAMTAFDRMQERVERMEDRIADTAHGLTGTADSEPVYVGFLPEPESDADDE